MSAFHGMKMSAESAIIDQPSVRIACQTTYPRRTSTDCIRVRRTVFGILVSTIRSCLGQEPSL